MNGWMNAYTHANWYLKKKYNTSETHEYNVVRNLSNSFSNKFYSLCKIPQTTVRIECKIPT